MENTYPNYQSKTEISNAIEVLTKLYVATIRNGDLTKVIEQKIKDLIGQL